MEYANTHSQSPPKPSPVNDRESDEPRSSISMRPPGGRGSFGLERTAAEDRKQEERRKGKPRNSTPAIGSPFQPGRNTLEGHPGRHARSTHGVEPNPAQRAGGSRQHRNSSPINPNGSPFKLRGDGEPADAPPPKRLKLVGRQTFDPLSGAPGPSNVRERMRNHPPSSEVIDVQSSEDERGAKAGGASSSTVAKTRGTQSRSASPRKSDSTRNPPGPHRLVAPSPEPGGGKSPVSVGDEDEDEPIESIEQFSSSAETVPPPVQKKPRKSDHSPSKQPSSLEKRVKAPMRKKDGSVTEPVKPTAIKTKPDSKGARPHETFCAKLEYCFSGDRPLFDAVFELQRGHNALTLTGKTAPGAQEHVEEIPFHSIKEVTVCLDPPVLSMVLDSESGLQDFQAWVDGAEPERNMILRKGSTSKDLLNVLLNTLPRHTTVHHPPEGSAGNARYRESLSLTYRRLQEAVKASQADERLQKVGKASPADGIRRKDSPAEKAFHAASTRQQLLKKVLDKATTAVGGTNSRRSRRQGSEEYVELPPADKRKGKGRADDPKQTKLEFPPPEPTRRSLRSTRQRGTVEDPSDSDEPLETEPPARAKTPRLDRNDVLFGWPLEGRSDVQVTKGDKYRLDEGDFLNDNFLDFGLRYTLHNSSDTNPGVGEKVHMFNSFFYDKLSKKEKGFKVSDEEWPAYDSVKKWTKTARIFEKDFIVVPINESLHWFLAVIYNPRGILKKHEPEPDSNPVTPAAHRPATRNSAKVQAGSDMGRQLSRKSSPEHQSSPKVADSDDPLDVIGNSSDANGDIEKMSGQVNNMSISPKRRDTPPPQPINTPTLQAFYDQDRPLAPERVQTPSSPPKKSAKKPRRREYDILAKDQTYIILLDSLGGTHKAVGQNLKRWLQHEAADKLQPGEVPNADEMSEAVYIDAKVIEQPNSSDCGVFLIHYVQCLLSDPQSVLQFIGSPPVRNEVDEDYDAELDRVWRRSDTEKLRFSWAETLDELTATWRSLHDIPAPTQGMEASTTSVTALGGEGEPLHAAALPTHPLADGDMSATHIPGILSPSPPASPQTSSRQLPVNKPSLPLRLSPDHRSEASLDPGSTEDRGVSDDERTARGSSAELYQPVDLEGPRTTPRRKRGGFPFVDVLQRVPGSYPPSTAAGSSNHDDIHGRATPLHHTVGVGPLPRMINSSIESSREGPREPLNGDSSRHTPSITESASDKENADDKENEGLRREVSPASASTLDGPGDSHQDSSIRERPRSLPKRLADATTSTATASKLKRTDPAPTRRDAGSTSRKPSTKEPASKRQKLSEAARNDFGTSADRAISIESDSGDEH